MANFFNQDFSSLDHSKEAWIYKQCFILSTMAITLYNYIWPYWDKAQRYMGPAMCTTGWNPALPPQPSGSLLTCEMDWCHQPETLQLRIIKAAAGMNSLLTISFCSVLLPK